MALPGFLSFLPAKKISHFLKSYRSTGLLNEVWWGPMIAFLFLSQNTRRSERLDSLIEDTAGYIHACGSGFSDTCVLLSVEVQ